MIAQRQGIIDETDNPEGGGASISDDDLEDAEGILRGKNPSAEALAKITDYCKRGSFYFLVYRLRADGALAIPYVNDEQAQAGCTNPHVKLLFKLCKFFMCKDGKWTLLY